MQAQIGCNELFNQLGDEEVLVIDCRSEDDWLTFGIHIPGALRMTIEELTASGHVLPEDELIVLCGSAPDGSDARRATRLLRYCGRNAVCLRGGLSAWVTAGYPTERHERGVPPPPARERLHALRSAVSASK